MGKNQPRKKAKLSDFGSEKLLRDDLSSILKFLKAKEKGKPTKEVNVRLASSGYICHKVGDNIVFEPVNSHLLRQAGSQPPTK